MHAIRRLLCCLLNKSFPSFNLGSAHFSVPFPFHFTSWHICSKLNAHLAMWDPNQKDTQLQRASWATLILLSADTLTLFCEYNSHKCEAHGARLKPRACAFILARSMHVCTSFEMWRKLQKLLKMSENGVEREVALSDEPWLISIQRVYILCV